MNKILLSTVALLTLSAGAMAADLPSRRMAPAPFVAAVPVFTWTGFHFGVNAGYGFSDNNHDDTIRFAPGTFGAGTGGGTISFNDRNGDSDGPLGGAQVGFNYQFTPGSGFVVGIEADIQAIDLDRDRGDSNSFAFTGPVPAGFQPIRNDVSTLDYFGTVRGKLGYAFDRTMVYATGGFAYGGGDNHSDCDRFTTSGFCNRGNDDTRYGYTVGGGVEFALPITASLFGSTAVTFKIEGLYVNLEEDHEDRRDLVGFRQNGQAVFNAGGGNVRSDRDNETDFGLVRAGINFKF